MFALSPPNARAVTFFVALLLLLPAAAVHARPAAEPWSASRRREILSRARPGQHVLVRGVAPREAGGAGRVHGRENYGIADQGVRPGYWLKPNLDERDLRTILDNVAFYANEGAAAEAFLESGMVQGRGHDFRFARDMGQALFPSARGYVLVYQTRARLKPHPESNAELSHLVVEIPPAAVLVARFELPERSCGADLLGEAR